MARGRSHRWMTGCTHFESAASTKKTAAKEPGASVSRHFVCKDAKNRMLNRNPSVEPVEQQRKTLNGIPSDCRPSLCSPPPVLLSLSLSVALSLARQDILEWQTSRQFFYWRLRRLLLEETVKRKIQAANSELTDGQVQAMLRRWFVEAEGAVKVNTSGETGRGLESTEYHYYIKCWPLQCDNILISFFCTKFVYYVLNKCGDSKTQLAVFQDVPMRAESCPR